MRESRQTGLLRLRHLQETTEAKAEGLAELRPRFERLADPASAPRAVQAWQLFQTPPNVADLAVGMLGPLDGCRVLEPSAGLGRLYRAVRKASTSCECVLVEIAPDCAAELYRETEGDDHTRLVQADFLECDAQRLGGLFDRIVMNPPFKMGRDIKHINHARGLLSPGGRLVSLCGAGPRQQAKLQTECDHWHPLPAGSFRTEGTNVETAIVVFEGSQ